MVIRGDSLKSTLSHYLVTASRPRRNIEVLARSEVTALHGDRRCWRDHVARSRHRPRAPCADTLAVRLHRRPATDAVGEAIGMQRDEAGYLVTGPDLLHDGQRPPRWPLDREPYFLETNIAGVFAAGDVRHGRGAPRRVGGRRRRDGGGLRAPLPRKRVTSPSPRDEAHRRRSFRSPAASRWNTAPRAISCGCGTKTAGNDAAARRSPATKGRLTAACARPMSSLIPAWRPWRSLRAPSSDAFPARWSARSSRSSRRTASVPAAPCRGLRAARG